MILRQRDNNRGVNERTTPDRRTDEYAGLGAPLKYDSMTTWYRRINDTDPREAVLLLRYNCTKGLLFIQKTHLQALAA